VDPATRPRSYLIPNVFLGSILIALTAVITLGIFQLAAHVLAV
jgi:hypothetical protein